MFVKFTETERIAMKKYSLLLSLALILCGCSNLDKYINVGSNATPQEKFRACALNEARGKLQNGTLFAQDLTTTKNDIVNTCIRKMALEAAGIDSEAQTITSNIINSLRAAQ